MVEEAFLTEWRHRLSSGVHGVKLVAAEHPLEIYVGSSDLGHALVQIRCTSRPRLPELSQLVLVTLQENEQRWVLSLNLQDVRFNEVFLRLVGHLIASSQTAPNADEAWEVVEHVLDEWKRLLRVRPVGVLSTEELRGLVGEVWLLVYRFFAELPVDAAVAGWLGPLAAPQDFWYEESGFYEAKAIGPTATHIKISSSQQLDQSGMQLVVLHVPECVESDAGAVSLKSLLAAATSALIDAGCRTADLEFRLRRIGVDLKHPIYADTWFRVTTAEYFTVDAGFPAIRQSELPPGVDRVRYNLDRRSIAPFLTASELL
jgi:hypothetical protein